MNLIALDYAKRFHWHIFPCEKRGKRPITQHGFKDATTDAAQINQWWAQHPEANIGLDCGRSGLVVIDLDGQEGIENWNALQDAAQIPPHQTTIAHTGSGHGAHIYYRAPAGVDIRNSTSKLAKGIDVRAQGGYVVLPPSVTEKPYTWEHNPDEGIAPLPDALLKLLTEPETKLTLDPQNRTNGNGHQNGFTMRDGDYSLYVQGAIDGEIGNLRAAHNGTRNHTLNSAAFNLATLGLPHAEIESILLPVALDVGLTEKESRATIASGHKGGAQKPRTIPSTNFVLIDSEPTEAEKIMQMGANGNGHATTGTAQTNSKTNGNSTQQPRYVLHWAREALEPQPPIEWIIENLFSAGSVSLVFGEGGSKKTWSVLDAAVAVAQGETWLNFATKQVTVLLIDEESGTRRLNRRLADVMRGHNASADIPIAYTCFAQWNLTQQPDVNEIRNLIIQTGARLVIIDALADVMLGADENSVKEIQPLFMRLRIVADETQSAIVIVHHSNRNGFYRGSSAIRGAVDLMLSVESKPDSDEVKFEMEKTRDVSPQSFSARANFAEGIFNLSPMPTSATKATRTPAEEFVIRFLKANGDSEMSKITGNADCCTAEQARKAVYSLTQKGITERTDKGSQGKKAIYGLVKKDVESFTFLDKSRTVKLP